ncbi:hypothetical protein Mpsy_0599 [Methanolobus psychrophilus R15]|nr:hypothetical protein Mpsy_0599 [Methanolobus psychrophilus R15]
MVVVSSLSGFRIPVTGGAGFIGSHAADRPVRIGIVFDHPGFGRADPISRHPDNGVGI